MLLTRPPRPVLRPFVKTLWASDQSGAILRPAVDRERVLPTGMMHLVFRLSDHPLHLYEGVDDARGRTIGLAIVGGARATSYIKDASRPVHTVGAQLYPGVAQLLFGVPADELSGFHTPLSDLWGPSAEGARERLAIAGSLSRELDVLESILANRLPAVRGLHPAVAHALERFAETGIVREVVSETGYSHRRFIELFRSAVGLRPKVFWRVIRFQKTLARLGSVPGGSLTELAMDSGYSDQAHFNREFREFAGISPGQYRNASPIFPNHVTVRR